MVPKAAKAVVNSEGVVVNLSDMEMMLCIQGNSRGSLDQRKNT
jgi:hypothetical protein